MGFEMLLVKAIVVKSANYSSFVLAEADFLNSSERAEFYQCGIISDDSSRHKSMQRYES